MKNNIITKIWNIRGMLDKAIDTQNIELAELAQQEFNKIYETEIYHNSFAMASINRLYNNVEQLFDDRDYNFALLASRFAILKKEFKHVEAETGHVFQFVSIIDIIWYTRGMYDFFMKYINEGDFINKDVNILASAIAFNFEKSIEYYDDICGVTEDVYNKYVIKQLQEKFMKEYGCFATEKIEV